MCAGAIVQARIPTLIYGTTDPKAGASHSLYQITNDDRLNHQATVISGLDQRGMQADFARVFPRRSDALRQEVSENNYEIIKKDDECFSPFLPYRLRRSELARVCRMVFADTDFVSVRMGMFFFRGFRCQSACKLNHIKKKIAS